MAAPRRSVLSLDGIDGESPSRSVRLAAVRNRLLDEVRARPECSGAGYLVVMDMDDASLAISPDRLRRCMGWQGWDALFANQLFFYYDVWALRDDRRSPDDWVSRVMAAPPGWRRRVARLRYLTWRNRPIWPGRRPFPVRSAFGGLAIYRMPLPLEARYNGCVDGQEICEHVPFNAALVDAGARLYVHPGLINMLPGPLYALGRAIGAL